MRAQQLKEDEEFAHMLQQEANQNSTRYDQKELSSNDINPGIRDEMSQDMEDTWEIITASEI
ncbi:MAG: hypothetical protein MRQ09_05425 [Candidatus Midichloria sp.]|nr:hypothetical protein [Candidatus Midichloria sp.]